MLSEGHEHGTEEEPPSKLRKLDPSFIDFARIDTELRALQIQVDGDMDLHKSRITDKIKEWLKWQQDGPEITCKIAGALQDEMLTFQLLANLKNFTGYFCKNTKITKVTDKKGKEWVNISSSGLTDIEGLDQCEYLCCQLYLMMDIYLQLLSPFTLVLIPTQNGTKTLTAAELNAFLTREIWLLVNAIFFKEQYQAALSPQINEPALAELVINFLNFHNKEFPTMDVGNALCLPAGFIRHAMYWLFTKQDTHQSDLRIDNRGTGRENHTPDHSKTNHRYPYYVQTLILDQNGTVNIDDDLATYLQNVCKAKFQPQDTALKIVYVRMNKLDPVSKDMRYDSSLEQNADDCVIANFRCGFLQRLKTTFPEIGVDDLYNNVFKIAELNLYADLPARAVSQPSLSELIKESNLTPFMNKLRQHKASTVNDVFRQELGNNFTLFGRANLSNQPSRFRYMNFSKLNCAYTLFQRTDLTQANFKDTGLYKASLEGCVMYQISDLTEFQLAEAFLADPQNIPQIYFQDGNSPVDEKALDRYDDAKRLCKLHTADPTKRDELLSKIEQSKADQYHVFVKYLALSEFDAKEEIKQFETTL